MAALTFFTSNFFLLSAPASAAPDLDAFAGTLVLAGAVSAAASCISTSAILNSSSWALGKLVKGDKMDWIVDRVGSGFLEVSGFF